jgi:hypothetical protein
MEEFVAAFLRFQHQGEGRVALDVDAGDMVHLDGDGKRHGEPSFRKAGAIAPVLEALCRVRGRLGNPGRQRSSEKASRR